jgi:fatty acid desaturase
MEMTADSQELESSRFSIKQAKELVRDLHKPVPWIYWTDFLASILTAHTAFALNVNAYRWLHGSPGFVWTVKAILFFISVTLFLRSAMFTHELVHLPKQGWTAFRIVWNLLCGIPMFIPSFLYYPHIDHHRRKSFGTHEDGEYLNLSHQPPSAIIVYMLGTLVTPLLAFLRFGVFSPIAWCYPPFRKWTYVHASTMVMDISYERPESGSRVFRIMLLQEFACFLVCVGMVLHAPLIAKTWYDPLWFHAYAMALALLNINNLRTLGSHRWTGEGSELSFEQQLLDSCDYPKCPWITELWGPTGTRYHATHHLFPGLPYHNLGEAHRRLWNGLPADSLYRETTKGSLTSELIYLWKRSCESSTKKKNKPNGGELKKVSTAA